MKLTRVQARAERVCIVHLGMSIMIKTGLDQAFITLTLARILVRMENGANPFC